MSHWDDDDDWYDDEEDLRSSNLIDGVGFADPGGESALRAETPDNPRDQTCPTCHWPNVLTRIDVMRGYQCDSCATANERGTDIQYYEGDDDPPEDNDDAISLGIQESWNDTEDSK